MEHPPHADEQLLVGWMAGAPRPYDEGPMPLAGTTMTPHQHQQQGQGGGEKQGNDTTPTSSTRGVDYNIYILFYVLICVLKDRFIII